MAGSGKRQRTHVISIRMNAEERARVTALTEKSGLAMGAFARAALLGDAGPRAQRRPPADHLTLRQLLGQCGRIGNNLNQIARELNSGEQIDLPELREALAAYTDIRAAVFRALGMTTYEAPRDRQGKQPRRA